MAIDALMKCTLPSAKAKLAPPGWRLLEFWNSPPSVPEADVKEHALHEYWFEEGGTTMFNMDMPSDPMDQRAPLLQPGIAVPAWKAYWQAWRSGIPAAMFELAKNRPPEEEGGVG